MHELRARAFEPFIARFQIRARSLHRAGLRCEMAFQLNVRPMIKRIAQGVRNSRGPCLKFREGIASPVQNFSATRWNAWPPFVVVAFQQISKRLLTAVLSNVLRRKMAVVIQNRLVFRVGVIKPRRCGCSAEIFVDEFHNQSFQTDTDRTLCKSRLWTSNVLSNLADPKRANHVTLQLQINSFVMTLCIE